MSNINGRSQTNQIGEICRFKLNKLQLANLRLRRPCACFHLVWTHPRERPAVRLNCAGHKSDKHDESCVEFQIFHISQAETCTMAWNEFLNDPPVRVDFSSEMLLCNHVRDRVVSPDVACVHKISMRNTYGTNFQDRCLHKRKTNIVRLHTHYLKSKSWLEILLLFQQTSAILTCCSRRSHGWMILEAEPIRIISVNIVHVYQSTPLLSSSNRKQ